MSTEKPPLSFRVPTDTKEKFEAYQKEHDITQSDAGRRLLEEGLEAKTSEASESDQRTASGGLFAEAAASFAGSATLFALLATVVLFVSPALLAAEIVFAFWVVAGVSNAATIVAVRRGWFASDNGGAR